MEIIDQWTLNTLPRLNSQVLAGQGSLPEILGEMNLLLDRLPDPYSLSPVDMKRLLILLGIWGSSAVRHFQEQFPESVESSPSKVLELLTVSPDAIPFKVYFCDLALSSGTGHPNRDAYASLVRWNTPATQACWNGECIASLPGVFEDGRTRTCTEIVGEQLILDPFKRVETLERAANLLLDLLWRGAGHCSVEESKERFLIATHMLADARLLFLEFPSGDHRGKLTPDHFIDVFRQFAVHWEPHDVPPSGPQDVEYVTRDLMTGVGSPTCIQHVKRIFPGLLAEERMRLSETMGLPSLPDRMMKEAGLSTALLSQISESKLAETVQNVPLLEPCFQYLNASVRVSAIHLSIAKRFLFKEMRRRQLSDDDGNAVVPNHMGITGLVEQVMERLHRVRQHHPLDPSLDSERNWCSNGSSSRCGRLWTEFDTPRTAAGCSATIHRSTARHPQGQSTRQPHLYAAAPHPASPSTMRKRRLACSPRHADRVAHALSWYRTLANLAGHGANWRGGVCRKK